MTPVAHACLCRFLTRILASLPYKKEEEPLVVISEIGKQMHLFGGYGMIPFRGVSCVCSFRDVVLASVTLNAGVMVTV